VSATIHFALARTGHIDTNRRKWLVVWLPRPFGRDLSAANSHYIYTWRVLREVMTIEGRREYDDVVVVPATKDTARRLRTHVLVTWKRDKKLQEFAAKMIEAEEVESARARAEEAARVYERAKRVAGAYFSGRGDRATTGTNWGWTWDSPMWASFMRTAHVGFDASSRPPPPPPPPPPRRPDSSALAAAAERTLGVSASTDYATAKRAYLDKMRVVHPDAGGDAEQAKVVTRAWAMLRSARGWR